MPQNTPPFQYFLKLCLYLCLISFTSLSAAHYELQVGEDVEESWFVNLPPQTTIKDLKLHISLTMHTPPEEQYLFIGDELLEDHQELGHLSSKRLLWIRSSTEESVSTQKPGNKGARDYWAELTEEEKGIIRYQVKEMANSSLARLIYIQKHLEEMAAEIDHVHPIRFLLFCFQEEELKVCMRNVQRGYKWVWKALDKRVSASLRRSKNHDNLNDDQIYDMAALLNIPAEPLKSPIYKCQGGQLISTLIKLVPREGEHNRYDF